MSRRREIGLATRPPWVEEVWRKLNRAVAVVKSRERLIPAVEVVRRVVEATCCSSVRCGEGLGASGKGP